MSDTPPDELEPDDDGERQHTGPHRPEIANRPYDIDEEEPDEQL